MSSTTTTSASSSLTFFPASTHACCQPNASSPNRRPAGKEMPMAAAQRKLLTTAAQQKLLATAAAAASEKSVRKQRQEPAADNAAKSSLPTSWLSSRSECSSSVATSKHDQRRHFFAAGSASNSSGGSNYRSRRSMAPALCSSDDDSGCAIDEMYAWVPPKTKPELVHSYFAQLPADKVPRIGSAGEQWRLRQLAHQLPPQDVSAKFCASLSAQESRELADFARQRQLQALGCGLVRRLGGGAEQQLQKVGGGGGSAGGGAMISGAGTDKFYCHQCKCAINAGELVVAAPQHFEDQGRALWHPGCFVCVECKELLVDLIYFRHKQNVFCGRHHAELIKPRCAGCDELIFSEECTEAEGRIWHMRHFCCTRCGLQLGGQQYAMQEELQQPLCLTCSPPRPASSSLNCCCCNTCGKEIAPNRPHIAQRQFHWHMDERCFCCSHCERALIGKPYQLHSGGRLSCSPGQPGCAGSPQQRAAQHVKLHQHQQPHSPILPAPPSPPPSPPQQQQTTPSPSHSARTVHFNLEPATRPLSIGSPQPPPLPKRGPPPIPLAHRPHQQPQQQPQQSTPLLLSENVYETVASIVPASNKMEAGSTTLASNSTSSGCSANGSLCSSTSKGNASSNFSPTSPLAFYFRQRSAATPYLLEDLSSNSSSEEEEGEERNATIGVSKRCPRVRRCRSADGRRRPAGAGSDRCEQKDKHLRLALAHQLASVQHSPATTIGDNNLAAALALASTFSTNSRRRHRRRRRRHANWPFERSSRTLCSLTSSSSESESESSGSEDENEERPSALFLRHYLLNAVSAQQKGGGEEAGSARRADDQPMPVAQSTKKTAAKTATRTTMQKQLMLKQVAGMPMPSKSASADQQQQLRMAKNKAVVATPSAGNGKMRRKGEGRGEQSSCRIS